MKTRSLYFKLICFYGTTVALLVVCAGILLYFIIKTHNYRRFDGALISDARIFVTHVEFGQDGLGLSTKKLDPRLSSVMRDLVPFAVVTDEFGRIVYKNAYSPYMQAMIHAGKLDRILRQHSGIGEAVAADGTVFRFVSLEIPSKANLTKVIVHIGRSTYRLRWVLNSYVTFYLYSVPFMILISIAAGWFITSQALRPFKDLAKAAEQISSENLDTQITTKYREKEVQVLVKSFNAMVDRLNRSFQQMRRFNADAAHELRTPLSIIRSETELLLRSKNLDKEEIRSALGSNLEELDRLTRIINDMLMLSEAEAGEQVLLKEPIDLKIFIEDLIGQLRTLAEARDIQIKLLNIADVQVEGDRSLLHRAFLKILDNAIKYSKNFGKVEVSSMVQDARLKLKVQDYGIGISSADLPYIFDRLFRADRARNRDGGGTGLGLSMAKWIIEAHQGNIQVISCPDQGTIFEISLPVKSGII